MRPLSGRWISQPPPPLIFHYTNDVGLKGILDTGKLWFTDIFDLNDPSELSHGFSHAVTILNGMAAGGPPESKLFAQQFEALAHREEFRPPRTISYARSVRTVTISASGVLTATMDAATPLASMPALSKKVSRVMPMTCRFRITVHSP